MKRARHSRSIDASSFDDARRHHIPKGAGAKSGRRQVERFVAQDATAANLATLITSDLARNFNSTDEHFDLVVAGGLADQALVVHVDNRDVDLGPGLGVLAAISFFDGGNPIVEIEVGDTIRLALV